VAQGCAARYRVRNPSSTPLSRLFGTHFDEVSGQWEERFERRCGFWRGFVDEQVRRYLDCGLFENGSARIRCPSRGSEMKVIAFITERDVVDAILRHLAKAEARSPRGPPGAATFPAIC
jgi:hypothetical protein